MASSKPVRFRVRIVMSTLIAMARIVSDTLYPVTVLFRWGEGTPPHGLLREGPKAWRGKART